jgi:hypothetical protein
MTKSVRRQILESMEAFIAGTAVTVNGVSLTFPFVQHGPLDLNDHKRKISVGIVTQPEKYENAYPFLTRMLQVALEFRLTINQGDEVPGLLVEDYLTALETIVLTNQDWGGLAMDTNLIANQTDISNYVSRAVLGVLTLTVTYRHNFQDPQDANSFVGP